MQYAEVIYEPGDKSVMSYDSESELQAALKEQHTRAVSGDSSGPSGGPASRISKVLLYKDHPGNLGENGMVGAGALKSLIDGMADSGDQVNGNQLIAAIRDEMSPVFPQDQGVHESIYKTEGENLDLSFLNTGDE